MLLIKEILNPDYGMFKEYEETDQIWFNPMSFEDKGYYFLIGVLYGLAIYNFTILNVPFPLKNGGEDISVTSDNKHEYVKLYIEYVLFQSCEAQFDAFKKGFLKVVSARVLQLFHPQELMALVVGNENYDWNLLEKLCEYKEGYSEEHEVIKHFWEVFRELSDENKNKFLLFLTGSDRIPIAGMSSVKITIQMTKDTNFLPVAHTCFNLLDLPDYGTKEKLKFKLLQAIECTKGFGL